MIGYWQQPVVTNVTDGQTDGRYTVASPRGETRQTKCRRYYRYRRYLTRSSAIAVIADRTACSILTLFIVSTASRPLNKKSVCCHSADPRITADLRPQSARQRVRNPHISAL